MLLFSILLGCSEPNVFTNILKNDAEVRSVVEVRLTDGASCLESVLGDPEFVSSIEFGERLNGRRTIGLEFEAHSVVVECDPAEVPSANDKGTFEHLGCDVLEVEAADTAIELQVVAYERRNGDWWVDMFGSECPGGGCSIGESMSWCGTWRYILRD